MARTKLYQVKDNRIRFKCEECEAKRSLPVPPHVRSRSVRCHNCGALARCSLNRRIQPRQQQRGRVTMTLAGGKAFSVDLHDISPAGVGLIAAPGAAGSLNLKEEIRLRCGWNPLLFAQGRYIVKNINGDRVGIQNTAYKTWL